MKKKFTFLGFIVLLLMAACSEDETTPQERFTEYVNHWNEQEFAHMYSMVTSNTAETYPTEEFADRYNKIYSDLNVSDLNVTFDKLSEEAIEDAMDQGTAQFPFTVEMDSIAGPISFDYEATLIEETEETQDGEETNWNVKWDPGFIFPEIQDGGDIGLETTEPERGEILDRNQLPLATNDAMYEIGVQPGQLNDNPDTEQAKQEIADLLNISVETIDNSLNQSWVGPDMHVPLKKVNDEDLVSELREIEGVSEQSATGRVYPEGEVAAQLTGYVSQVTKEDLENMESSEDYSSDDMIGQRGLEQLYEDRLKGERGVKITAVNEEGDDTVIAEKPVKDGENIKTTIDITVQEAIYDTLGDDAGTAAAIHPKTGETLALVSSPSFNPREMVSGLSQSRLDELENDPQQPTLNRFSATYAPGSVIKPVTAAIGLNNGSIVPGEGIEINGLTWQNGEAWGDYEVKRVSESDGPVDVTDALIRSDNIYFAKKAVEMGTEAFTDGMRQFGFGNAMPFDYPIETSTLSSSGSIDDEVQLANTSYGQGQLQMSALHLAMSYTPILNEGNMLKPTLLTSKENSQIWKEGLMTGEDASVIQDALRDVVAASNGTAPEAQEADFAISGKTGTAELKKNSDEEGKENGWFVGYPTEDQNILIAMMIENTKDRGGSHYTTEKVTDILNTVK